MKIKFNKDKRIGKVLFIVEGENTEFYVLRKIFTTIFDYQCETEKRSSKYNIYNKKDNPLSSIFVVNSKQVQMDTLNDYKYLENLYVKLQDEYKFPLDNACIYYIFDRDVRTNNLETINDLINRLNNSRESTTYDIQGLLLLSYPAIEAFTISNFLQNSFDIEFELGKQLKIYAHENNCNHQKINEETLKLAVDEMHKGLSRVNALDYDLDNFTDTNKTIIEAQEKNFEQKNTYNLLSLLCVALIDLGLIEIQQEEEKKEEEKD